MIDRWAGRDVDLELLSERIKHFFDEKQLPSRVEVRSKKEFWITAILGRTSGASLTGNVKVTVCGKPEDFEVEFVAGSQHLTRLSSLITLLGGGVLLLRDLKSAEEFERLEKEFWLFVDKQVDSLGKKERGKVT